EGLNGRINVRQSQVRFSPPIGEDFRLQFSLEDPNPQIQNGNGVTRVPDIVMAARFKPHERLHVRAAILGRQIRGQEVIPTSTPGEVEEGGVDKSYAWGFSLSGSFRTPLFDSRDKLLFQLNRGNGIGRYVNDLNSIGNYDGIFNPATNKLQLFNVFAGYGSLQHWWADTMRSNFTLGLVDVNNPEFVDGNAYKRTIRASANLLWNPTPRIDTGIEYLWGRREDKDGEDGDAQQIQTMVRYLF
ncbi:MAG: DcaP family trimeric outer membrane transporter, partial [Pseudomonadota bacterium]